MSPHLSPDEKHEYERKLREKGARQVRNVSLTVGLIVYITAIFSVGNGVSPYTILEYTALVMMVTIFLSSMVY